MGLEQEIHDLRQQADREVDACTAPEQTEALKIKYLGRKGVLRDLFGKLGTAPEDQRPALGASINELKEHVARRVGDLEEKFSQSVTTRTAPTFDVTLPGTEATPGRRHPISKTLDEVKTVFQELGFEIVTGPEIETSYHNFDALNIPSNHPARDAFDTFYIEGDLLLRSHTSPVQIRTMKSRKPPLRIIAPGRVFRPDTPDAGHAQAFHQVEGLMVGEDVTFAHLKGVLELFARRMFGSRTRMRFRPSFFPFTEPSAEVDISCILCHGKGCRACKMSGWMEILGSGMVHPQVFRNVGYDPEQVTGFAFGLGIERIAMLRFGIPDIRLFTENHHRFLRQF